MLDAAPSCRLQRVAKPEKEPGPLNCTPKVRQYGIQKITLGVISCQEGQPNKRYTAEFKRQVIETMQKDGISYRETAREFEVSSHHRIQDWERIYLTFGAEGFQLERRGRGNKERILNPSSADSGYHLV